MTSDHPVKEDLAKSGDGLMSAMFAKLKKNDAAEDMFDKKKRKEHKKKLGNQKEDWNADAYGSVLSHEKM